MRTKNASTPRPDQAEGHHHKAVVTTTTDQATGRVTVIA